MSCFWEDTALAAESPSIVEAVDACLARAGRDGWAEVYVGLAERTGAAQIMVFSYRPAAASCLLSRNFRTLSLGVRLAEDYLGGWFRDDPLYAEALALRPGEVLLRESDAVMARMSDAYRARFYDRPGLAGKTAVLAAGGSLRLVTNLYWGRPAGPRPAPALLSLLGRLALLHFEALPEHAYPAPLAVLSERERAVCLGILSGRKAEAIAGDLGVAASSVVTYRARAYRKLGISSRGALFAMCGG